MAIGDSNNAKPMENETQVVVSGQNPQPMNPFHFNRKEYEDFIAKHPHVQPNKHSEYDEMELVENCTLYDIYRQPRAPITDLSATRTLSIRNLNADLTCPICFCIIRQTTVVMECLHRFCKECIDKYLRENKNGCPSCRIHIPSKRSTRPDENFDALIRSIYPNVQQFEESQDKLIEQINRARHFHSAITKSTQYGIKRQDEAKQRNSGKKKKFTTDLTNDQPNESGKRTAASPSEGEMINESLNRKKRRTETNSGTSSVDQEESVSFRVLLHPAESNERGTLRRTLFRTSYRLKIRHLKKHIGKLLSLSSADVNNMHIILCGSNYKKSGLSDVENQNESYTVTATESTTTVREDLQLDQEVENFLTLYEIYQQFGMGTSWELQLYYHFSSNITTDIAKFISSGI